MLPVYLDNNATTPVDPEVYEAMAPFLTEEYGNASSVHQQGQRARSAVEKARAQVAELLGAEPGEILFTSGGTESDNLAVWGAAMHGRKRGRHIVTSRIEHPAVLRTCEVLEADGFRVTYLDVEADSRVSPDSVERAFREDTILVSIMYVNNETGAVEPIPEIVELARERGVLVHTDAVQAAGKIPLDVKECGVDLLSISAHKFHGPKGVGALYVRDGVELVPLMLGGSHEKGRRGGTENVPGIVAIGEACAVGKRRLDEFESVIGVLRDRLEQNILESIPGTHVNGSKIRAPHVANISFDGVQGETLLVALDFNGIAVSTGAACAAGSISASHVLTAMDLPESRIRGAIRFSLGRFTSDSDIDHVLDVLPSLVERAREAAPETMK
jgi:cysteine desulfurase